jgi:hypothetical protein
MDLAGKFRDWVGGPIQAFTKAGVNPMAAVTQNEKELEKAFSYYRNNPDKLNTLDLKSNMLMRYLSGVGSQGMQFPEGTGKQLLTDIREQDAKFRDSAYRQQVLNSANTPEYIKQGLLQGLIPVYYGGMSDAPAPIKSQLPIDVGQRGQLSKSIGSFWAQPTPGGGFTIDEKYNFGYAPLEKGGVPEGQNYDTGFDMNPANIGRRLIQKGYGNPYSYQIKLSPNGQLQIR